MRLRPSNLVLLFGIVVVLAAATGAGLIVKNRAAADVLADVERNATVLVDALALVETGESYVQTGDVIFLRSYEQASSDLDRSLVGLERTDTGPDAEQLIGQQTVAARRLQQAFGAAIEARGGGAEPVSLDLQGERFAIFDEVVKLNGETSSKLGDESLSRAQGRTDPVIALSILVLGGLIVALGLAARKDDRRRRRTRRFSEGLQAARSEGEAYRLLGAHLERSVPGAGVAVLNRNNSADRLEPATPVDSGSALSLALRDAEPDDCLAIRTAKASSGGTGKDDLLRCEICGLSGSAALCVPSIVGGKVIGSVLMRRQKRFNEAAERTVTEGVSEAAPVIAHLRSLALAERMAASDKLTGLPNKRSADDVFKQMLAQAARTDTSLAVLMFDLDHFKAVNDSHGHPKGDEVLAAVGAAIQDAIRKNDFAARHGGEEFLALLPGANLEGARRVAEKLRAAIASVQVPGVGRETTASFGIAVFPEDGGELDVLLKRADRAMYLAKRDGRNRVRTVDDRGAGNGAVAPGVPTKVG